ncbi:MAG TPA: Stp1/IreP family PP2C-type Ser/Thr phosphatase [Planctomycetes bacterium]|nr:Stp1/IreP family PP2C-type Ser/Thr phosphatase [Planctomycetota bacterium]
MKIRDDVEIGQHSHVGMARTENQDFFGYWEPDEDRLFDLKGRLAVVCDGMGGHSGGEIASRLAVKAIIDNYEQAESENIVEALRASIELANRQVYNEGQRLKELDGMGTTVTALVHRRDMVYFGQVGDSRAYLIRGGAMKQMTKDHSLVQQLVDEGLLDKSEMESHPDKNVILRSLGVKPEVEVDVSHIPIANGDLFLICSDGLSGLVTDDEMLALVNAGVSGQKALRQICEDLVNQANAAGGHDNITVQLLRINATDSATTDTTPEETVTAAFTQDQIDESIRKAREEAAARDGGAPAAAAAPAPAASEGPVIPATQPAMPVPQLEEPASASRSAGGLGKLLVGLLLGAVIGAGGTFAVLFARERGAAEAARDQAKETLDASKGNAVLIDKAKDAFEQGKAAYRENDFEEARARFIAAERLCELAGEAQ